MARRARKESDDLITLLERQQKEIDKELAVLRQTTFEQVKDKQQRKQIEFDIEATVRRQQSFQEQLSVEPAKIAALYEVQMTRVTPVGLVFAWPEGG